MISILTISDNEGYLPIHTLLNSSDPPASSLVKLLIQSNFSTIKHKTNQGWLPIHFVMKLSEYIRKNDEYEENEKLNSPGLVRQFTDITIQNSDNKITLPIHRIVAIIQELLSIYPESAYEPVLDIVPIQDDVDLETWTGGWKKIRWTPISYVSMKGKPSQLIHALKPFRKKIL